MSDRPVFIYAATYADRDDALADYDVLSTSTRRSSSVPTTWP